MFANIRIGFRWRALVAALVLLSAALLTVAQAADQDRKTEKASEGGSDRKKEQKILRRLPDRRFKNAFDALTWL